LFHLMAGDGDFNGDGWTDFVIGAPGSPHDSTVAGEVFLFEGPLTEVAFTFDATDTIKGDFGDGQTVSLVADLDGDGYAELILGSEYRFNDGATVAYAFCVQPGLKPLSATDPVATFVKSDIAGTEQAGLFADIPWESNTGQKFNGRATKVWGHGCSGGEAFGSLTRSSIRWPQSTPDRTPNLARRTRNPEGLT
jgi:hypothetical protein